LGQGVDSSYRRLRIFFQIDSEVVRMVEGECFCFGLAKNIGVLVVFFRNSGEIDFLEMVVDLACIVERNWRENVFKPERREAWSRAGALIIAI